MKTSKSKQKVRFFDNENKTTKCGILVEIHDLVDCPPHVHDYYEFEYVMVGEGECVLDGIAYPISAGDLIFASPSSIHAYTNKDTWFRLLHLSFYGWNLDHTFQLSEIGAGVFRGVLQAGELFEKLYAEWNVFDAYSQVGVQNAVERILIEFCRNAAEKKPENFSANIHAIRKYMMQHFREPIRLDEISKKCEYSPTYFSRCFKQETGMGFANYLANIRLDFARSLLLESGVSVTEACFESGFQSLRSFCRGYKKKFGVPPSEDRRMLRNS